MAYSMVRFKVADYAAWKQFYVEQGSAIRRANGARESLVFQNVDNPQEVVLLIDWENLDTGLAFAQSPETRELQRRAGVISRPEPYAASDRFDS